MADPASSPSSPATRRSMTPALSRSNSFGSMASTDLLDGPDLLTSAPSGMPLADLLETYVNPRLDWAERRFRPYVNDVKLKARARRENLVKRARSKQEIKALEKELTKLRGKVSDRVDKLNARWTDAKNVRLRDKLSFLVGVMNLVASSLIFAFRPEWVPLVYTLQSAFFLPIRVWTYTRLKWHYFLFDFCYAANVAALAFIWIWPASPFLFTIVYCAAHGPLAWSVITWRNSFVFHSLEKVTSTFIHIYPPFVFTTLRHFTPAHIVEAKYPAMHNLPELSSWTAFLFNLVFYAAWQWAYYIFIGIRKSKKIASGERINSYSTLSKGKGAIANLLAKVPDAAREPAFMLLQMVYTIVCTLPAPVIFYRSSFASATFLIFILTMSVWNGASYYVEVWGRRFEKELQALRRELEAAKEVSMALDSEGKPTGTTTSSNAGTGVATPVSGQGHGGEASPTSRQSSEGELVEARKDV
ncbi:hypothetical protein BDZ90DRAFT_229596 [Jaminaea rosea]|uniref:Glycerophosphocholine acyltransferase 1 n=1 Tax=Jaminaea rosea TaxID=1569628 RepID=A0A316UZ59_9BASI|nr:hypothetical protein BDZ90DRAFT_229596 [Jaminaea rosea]PWN30579.1 hypothetical protein BDZ90DRAFT_229596 [Jaminaea rosea]